MPKCGSDLLSFIIRGLEDETYPNLFWYAMPNKQYTFALNHVRRNRNLYTDDYFKIYEDYLRLRRESRSGEPRCSGKGLLDSALNNKKGKYIRFVTKIKKCYIYEIIKGYRGTPNYKHPKNERNSSNDDDSDRENSRSNVEMDIDNAPLSVGSSSSGYSSGEGYDDDVLQCQNLTEETKQCIINFSNLSAAATVDNKVAVNGGNPMENIYVLAPVSADAVINKESYGGRSESTNIAEQSQSYVTMTIDDISNFIFQQVNGNTAHSNTETAIPSNSDEINEQVKENTCAVLQDSELCSDGVNEKQIDVQPNMINQDNENTSSEINLETDLSPTMYDDDISVDPMFTNFLQDLSDDAQKNLYEAVEDILKSKKDQAMDTSVLDTLPDNMEKFEDLSSSVPLSTSIENTVPSSVNADSNDMVNDHNYCSGQNSSDFTSSNPVAIDNCASEALQGAVATGLFESTSKDPLQTALIANDIPGFISDVSGTGACEGVCHNGGGSMNDMPTQDNSSNTGGEFTFLMKKLANGQYTCTFEMTCQDPSQDPFLMYLLNTINTRRSL